MFLFLSEFLLLKVTYQKQKRAAHCKNFGCDVFQQTLVMSKVVMNEWFCNLEFSIMRHLSESTDSNILLFCLKEYLQNIARVCHFTTGFALAWYLAWMQLKWWKQSLCFPSYSRTIQVAKQDVSLGLFYATPQLCVLVLCNNNLLHCTAVVKNSLMENRAL